MIEVWLQIFHQSTEASLFDNSEQFTHFTGFILQEEIVSSLIGDFVTIVQKWSKMEFYCEKNWRNDINNQLIIESKVVKGWVFGVENSTVDVNWHKEHVDL